MSTVTKKSSYDIDYAISINKFLKKSDKINDIMKSYSGN